MIKRTVLYILLALFIHTSQAQNVRRMFKGTVSDSVSTQPIRDVTISFYKAKDTSLANFCFSTPNGNYNIEMHLKDSLLMIVTCIGYKERIFHITASEWEWDFENKDIKLQHANYSLGEIKITAGLISMKGDTIEINASRLKVLPNSDVSQLLQKIPGFEIKKDGSIKVNGSDVSRILVDGSDFFGSNPALVSKNLDADMIDKVQVFDDKDDNGQAAHNNTKTINLKLKKGKRLGAFGDAMAGVGNNSRYEAGLRMNSFKDDRKLSFISNSNNINGKGFDFGFNNWHNSYSLQRNGSSGTYNTFTNPLDIASGKGNINRTSDGAFSFFNEYTRKRKLSFSVTYTNNDYITTSNNTSIRALNDSTYQKSQNNQVTNGKSNDLNFSTTYSCEKDSTVRYAIGLNYGIGIYSQNYNSVDSIYFNKALVNQGINNYNRNTNKSNMAFNAHYYQRSKASKYSYISLGTSSDYNIGTTFNYQYSQGLNSNYNYKTNAVGSNFDILLNAAGSLHIYKSVRIALDMDAYKSSNDYMAQAYNALDSTKQDFNQAYTKSLYALSTHFYNSAVQLSTKLFLAMGGKSTYFAVGNTYLNLTLYNKDYYTGKDLSSPYNLFLPFVEYSNWQSGNGYTSVDLSRNVDFPTNIQLLPVSILNNPWVQITGNPYLLPFEQWSFGAYYNKSNYKMFKDIWANFSAHKSNSYIANNSIVDNSGITYLTPVNLSGYFTERASIGPSIKLNKAFNFNFDINQQFNQIPTIVNNVNYVGTTRIIGFEPGLEIIVSDKTEINLSTSLDYTQYINPNNPTLSFSQNIPVYSADIRTDLWTGAEIKSDISVTDNRAIPGIGKVVRILNVYYQQELDKKGKYNLKLTCYDILNQNIGLARTVTGSYISIQQNNILQRFFMLTLVYKMKGKKTEGGGAVY